MSTFYPYYGQYQSTPYYSGGYALNNCQQITGPRFAAFFSPPVVPFCDKCLKTGHFTENCRTAVCDECGQVGHIAKFHHLYEPGAPPPVKDLPPPKPKKEKEEEEVVICRECGEEGHIKINCPQTRCFSCNGFGHISRDCPRKGKKKAKKGKKSRARRGCHTCGELGHHSRDCVKNLENVDRAINLMDFIKKSN